MIPISQLNNTLIVSESAETNRLEKVSTTSVDKVGMMDIFPNPASDEFSISCIGCFSGEATCHLTLINSMGMTIFENYYIGKDAEEIKMNLAYFEDGVYYITLKGEGKSFQQKVIKLK